jgi:hypothetical protein
MEEDGMAMSERVRAEYEKAMARVVIKRGSLVSEHPNIYGWEEYSWCLSDGGKHLAKCGIKTDDTLRADEDRWDEFQGTFYEGDTSVHGARVDGISCQCGKVTGRSYRWKASMQEVAEAVFEEALR